MAVDYEEITDNPCRKVAVLPENNQRTRHLSFEEEDRLFAKLTGERKYLRPLITVAIGSNLRRTTPRRVTKASLVECRLRSESDQLHRDEDEQGSSCANGADCARSFIGTEPAQR